jgi:hypothetical protein
MLATVDRNEGYLPELVESEFNGGLNKPNRIVNFMVNVRQPDRERWTNMLDAVSDDGSTLARRNEDLDFFIKEHVQGFAPGDGIKDILTTETGEKQIVVYVHPEMTDEKIIKESKSTIKQEDIDNGTVTIVRDPVLSMDYLLSVNEHVSGLFTMLGRIVDPSQKKNKRRK